MNPAATGVLAEAVARQRSTIAVLFMTVFLDFLGFSIVLPYLFFFAQGLGATQLTYGLLVTSFGLMQFIFVPVMGRLSDRFGRRRILLLSLFGSGISFLLSGLANTLGLLFLARSIAGIMNSTVSVAQAYVADVSSERARLRYMGIIGAGMGMGSVVGPAAGGVLSSLYGYAVPSFLASALAFLNLVMAFFRLPEPKDGSRDNLTVKGALSGVHSLLRSGIFDQRMRLLYAINFASAMALTFLEVSLAPWLQRDFGFGAAQVSLVFIYAEIVNVATQAVLLQRIARYYSTRSILLIGLGVLSLSYLALGLFSSIPILLVAGGFLMLGFGLASPSVSSLISVNSASNSQGGNLGAGDSAGFLAQAISPVIATGIFSFGLGIDFTGLVFVVAAAVNSASLLVMLFGRIERVEARTGTRGSQ
jgi:MFS family permease